METISVRTEKEKEIIDITEEVDHVLNRSGAQDGICMLFVKHTTAAITTADLDPGTDVDILNAFAEMIPKLRYRHPHDPAHVPSHILSSLIGTSIAIPVKDSRCVLGAWQRIVLVEFDGPREREIILSFTPENSKS